MAASAVLPAMNGERTLHPFFKRNVSQDPDERVAINEIHAEDQVKQLDGAADDDVSGRREDDQPKKSQASATPKAQRTLLDVLKPRPNQTAKLVATQELSHPDSFRPAFNSSPRTKRRRTSLTESVELHDEDDGQEQELLVKIDRPLPRHNSPQVVVLASSPLPSGNAEPDDLTAKMPPKKMLRLKGGKFSSPVSKKQNDEGHPVEEPKRRRRPRKSKEVQVEKHLIVVMRYDMREELAIGHRIDRILSGEEQLSTKVEAATPKKQRTPRKQKPMKPTHPFFLDKPKEQEPAPAKHASPRKTSAVTPGKLRRQAMAERSPVKQPSRPVQDYVIGSDLLKDRLMFKHPGAKDPPWPSRELSHVRGLGGAETHEHDRLHHTSPALGKRKRKAPRIPFPDDESILKHLSACIRPEKEGSLRNDGFREPHPSLRLPSRLLISGQEIANRVAREIKVQLPNANEDELVRSASAPTNMVHPALQKLHSRLANDSTAFDDGRSESLSWTQKYEPSDTSEVLLLSHQIHVLRDWLTSLTITAVETTSKVDDRSAKKMEPKARKRRRKHDDLDDFLVDDDEVSRDMDELTDPEDMVAATGNNQRKIKSVVQTASDGVKLSNAVLLSGPHGCGKTAAAHAAAKELGFKVFEISPCERRSGKDVIDKVGNMTENHLVKHHGTDTGETSAAEEPARLDEAFQRDLVSGKQGKMNVFFKPKSKPKQSTPKKKVAHKEVLEIVHKAIKKPPKEQQQSLILLEEVDILFKDDKDFWNTVFKLIESSKRPFIMTCNDEDLVPLQAMSLHAILRFTSPPVDLATDYMLLMAASEGHLLKRDMLASLYETKNHDLRASIEELDFWCQMGIGDPRGGLSWLYQRYPPGSDLDAQGRRLRVVSDGTYQPEMSLAINDSLDDETRLLYAHHEYGVDALEAVGWHQAESKDGLSLAQFSKVCNALSDTDIYSQGKKAIRLDNSQSSISEKARSQYIEGLALLQTDEFIEYSGLTEQLGIASVLAALKSVSGPFRDIGQSNLKHAIQARHRNHEEDSLLTRRDFTCFDAISIPPDNMLLPYPGLAQSVFDGPLKPITTDIAPYVRSIVQYDFALAEQRERLDGLLNEGRTAKRARTTRAARSALEGSQRASTRRERWFGKDLDMHAVLATAGKYWPRMAFSVPMEDGSLANDTETPTVD